MKVTVYTIGHSNIEPDELIKRLNKFEIETLIDIRSKPHSRYAAHFSRDQVERLCEENHIRYIFLGDMVGGMPDDSSVTDDAGRVNYDALADKDYFRAGIDRVVDLARKSRTCLMCSEGQPDTCHRSTLVAPPVEKKGLEVVHILPDGTTISAEELKLKINKGQLTLF